VRRAAFISDVHSNIDALDRVLAEVDASDVYCLGDLVGYGASPNEVVKRLREAGAKAVMGNHDNAAVTGDASDFNPTAAIAVAWTRRTLTDANMEYLRRLPLVRREELERVVIHMVHGSPDDPLREYVDERTHGDLFSHYLSKTESDAIALGHTHVPYVHREKGVVFNPGSVGQPRDGDPRAAYALVTLDDAQCTVELRRVEYDTAAAAERIFEAGLPRRLGERLQVGH
jgi:putative phosphoesterase